MVFFSINVILHSIFLQGVTSENISTMYCLICPLMSSHYSVFVNVFTCLEEPSHVPISPQSYLQYTHIFLTIRCTPPPQIWEENKGAFYSPNVAYLACWGRAVVVEWGHRRQEQDHIFCFKISFPIFLL